MLTARTGIAGLTGTFRVPTVAVVVARRCIDFAVTVPGVTADDFLILRGPETGELGFSANVVSTGTDSARVRFCNLSAVNAAPSGLVYAYLAIR